VGLGGVLLALTRNLGWSAPESAGLSISLAMLMLVLAFMASIRMRSMQALTSRVIPSR
jgi:hypothetical protein